MSSIAFRIKELRKKIASLKKLRKDMDPASGITVHVKRGCDSDENGELQGREPISLNLCTSLEAIIDSIIVSASESLELNVAFAKSDIKELTDILDSKD